MLNNNRRYLIVNADDFGLSEGVNQGIIQSHEKGIVTSASLMTRYDAGRDAGVYARAHPELSVGLHVDLGEWVYREAEWVSRYSVVAAEQPDQIAEELMYQLERFRDLTGRDPTHLDSHQHVHRNEPFRAILVELALGLGIPLRECHGSIRHEGRFYGQSSRGESCHQCLSVDSLRNLVTGIPTGVTELGCHPGFDRKLDSVYRVERTLEVSTLCSEHIRSAIEDAKIELISFRDVSPLGFPGVDSSKRHKRRDSHRTMPLEPQP